MEKQVITGNETVNSISAQPFIYDLPDGTKRVDLGLTIRQHFAAMAMQGHLSNSAESETTAAYILERLGLPRDTKYEFEKHYTNYVAKVAVLYADALIAELNK